MGTAKMKIGKKYTVIGKTPDKQPWFINNEPAFSFLKGMNRSDMV